MPSNRAVIISFGALLILAAAFLVYSYVGDDREQVQIRARYTQMSLALSTGGHQRGPRSDRGAVPAKGSPSGNVKGIRKAAESKIIDQSFRAYSIRLPAADLLLQDFAWGSRD
jgi:hypothetical protein